MAFALLLIGVSVLGSAGDKSGINPEAGLSDSQRQALHDAAHARNSQFLHDFVAGGGDPRSLPVVLVESYGAPPLTLADALAESDAVVQGTVRGVTFADNPSGGMPLATATVDVTRKFKGAIGSVITVRQLGGPVAQGTGGALAEIDTDRLLLPGDEAILMLRIGTSGNFNTLPGAGVNLIKNGRVEAEAANPFGLLFTGRTVDEVAKYLT